MCTQYTGLGDILLGGILPMLSITIPSWAIAPVTLLLGGVFVLLSLHTINKHLIDNEDWEDIIGASLAYVLTALLIYCAAFFVAISFLIIFGT